jgi:membrane protein implicated in regulation of membrane protease activity
VIPDPERRPATGYGLRADELGQQMLMGGVAAASIALIIVLLIFAGFVIAGVLSIVAALVIVALLRLFEWESAPSEQMDDNATVYEQIADLVENNPLGEIDLGDAPADAPS